MFDRRLVQTPIDFAAGGAKARAIGARASVLLQNNGALPLRGDLRSLVLVGKASQVYAQQAVAGGAVVGEPMGAGGGSSDVVPHYTVTPLEGLRNALRSAGNVSASIQLILVDDDNQGATIDGRRSSFAKVLARVAGADAVVMMAGSIAEEGADRATFTDASGRQLAAPAAAGSSLDWYAPRSNLIATRAGANAARDSGTTAMIRAVLGVRSTTSRATSVKSVLVLKDNAGMAPPVWLVGDRGPAILEAWFPGQEDGNVVADVLFGRVNPSGKLPVTFPFEGKGFLDAAQPSQFPGAVSGDGGQQGVRYSEQLAIGYRWYDANVSGQCREVRGRNPCVAFPFGHGLSYTRFAVGTPRLLADGRTGGWRAVARVTNTGARAGAEVVQVYVTLPETANAAGARQPPRRLIGFARIELDAGRSGEVSIAIDPAASHHPLGVWDDKAHRWTIPGGRFKVWVGRSSSPADLVLAGHIER